MHSSLITFILKALNKSSRFLYRDYFELELQQSSRGSKNDFVEKSFRKCEESLKYELAKYGDKMWFETIPIEGIDNFARSIPFFAIIVTAYNRDETTPAAVVIEFPILCETYYSVKGCGMWLDRHSNTSMVNSAVRLRVSTRKENSILISDKHHIVDTNFHLRNFGSNAYAICLVASGKADVAYLSSLEPILLPAAKLFMQETGGQITSDNPLILSNGCSNIPL